MLYILINLVTDGGTNTNIIRHTLRSQLFLASSCILGSVDGCRQQTLLRQLKNHATTETPRGVEQHAHMAPQ